MFLDGWTTTTLQRSLPRLRLPDHANLASIVQAARFPWIMEAIPSKNVAGPSEEAHRRP